MQIFFLFRCPAKSARSLCNTHVVKMLTESCQILSTVYNNQSIDTPMARTHWNHPCCIWARTSLHNFNWLLTHATAIEKEYRRRYGNTGKQHKSSTHLRWLRENAHRLQWGCAPFSEPPQVIPDEYKQERTDKAYRAFYASKTALLKYTRRKPPKFLRKKYAFVYFPDRDAWRLSFHTDWSNKSWQSPKSL